MPSALLLLIRLAIPMLLLTIGRVLFFLFHKNSIGPFHLLDFFVGMRFDLVAVLWLYLPLILWHLIPLWFYKKISIALQFWMFQATCFVVLFFHFIDIEYFNFTKKRTTFDIINMMQAGNDLENQSIGLFLSYWYIMLFLLLALYLAYVLYHLTLRWQKTPPKALSAVLASLVITPFLLIGLRGGVQYKPLDIVHASLYVDQARVPLVLSSPFTLIKTLNDNGLSQKKYFDDSKAQQIFPFQQTFHPKDSFKRKNIVVLIVESLSGEYTGIDSASRSYTPFLDSLMENAKVFTQCYANGTRSIDGIPAVLSSIPSLMNDAFISSAYSGNASQSIASALKQKGYKTLFFHGGHTGTMGFNSYSKSAKFDTYYGLEDYPNPKEGFDGNWGIYDHLFLDFTAQTLKKIDTNFVACIFTLSSHQPYNLPIEYKEMLDSTERKILPSIYYIDQSLKSFFANIKKEKWYHNSLFVITADHTGPMEMSNTKGYKGEYHIPLILFDPQRPQMELITRLHQQSDVVPLLLEEINWQGTYHGFFNSNQKNSDENIAIQYKQGHYQMVYKNHLLLFDGKEIMACYNISLDNALKNNLMQQQKWVSLHNSLIFEGNLIFKAVIQQYNTKMIRNEWSN